MREIKLSDAELFLLDGKVNKDAQKIIDQAKLAQEHAELGELGSEVIRLALERGVFTWNHTRLNFCSLCKKSAGYAKYKSGYNRGRPNYKKPLSMDGIEFMRGFVSIKGFAANGGCSECVGNLVQKITEYILAKDLPIQLNNSNTLWVKEELQKCKKCGHECGQFDCYLDRPLMSDGWFYSGCPNCYEARGFLNHIWDTTGHRMIRVSEVTQMKNCWTRRAVGDRTNYEMPKEKEC